MVSWGYREPATLPNLPIGAVCAYCGARASGWDHIRPVRWGGTNERSNLTPCCWPCNRQKKDQHVEVWRMTKREREQWLRARGWMRVRDVPRDPSDRYIGIINGKRINMYWCESGTWFDPRSGRSHTFGWAMKYAAFADDDGHLPGAC